MSGTSSAMGCAIVELSELLKPGQEVRTRVEHASRSGMTRWISVHIAGDDGFGMNISGMVAHALGRRFDGRHEGVKIEGCGMDMGFALVYELSRTLFSNGFRCISDPDNPRAPFDCPSNDHANREHNDHHNDGGYALVQRWMA